MSLLILMAFPAFVLAQEGPNVGGGGGHLDADFRLRAQNLIAMIARIPDANSLCSASTMDKEFGNTVTRIVDKLIDPVTQLTPQEIDPNNSDLDAWTVPGDLQLQKPGLMQLLKSSWTGLFDPKVKHAGRAVDVLILHEIYRSTKNCNDDKYKISDKIFLLLSHPSIYSKVFAFTEESAAGRRLYVSIFKRNAKSKRAEDAESGEVQKSVCSLKPASNNVGKSIACLFVREDNSLFLVQGRLARYLFVHTAGHRGGDAWDEDDIDIEQTESLPQPLSGELFGRDLQIILNMFKTISPEQPLYLVFDGESGTWSFGPNIARLNPFPTD